MEPVPPDHDDAQLTPIPLPLPEAPTAHDTVVDEALDDWLSKIDDDDLVALE